jgi:Cytochrome c
MPTPECSLPPLLRCAARWALLLGGALLLGRRLYHEGRRPSGAPLQGVVGADVTLSGSQAACASCHRRSGYGSSEGPIEVRAITAAALFGQRPAPSLAPRPAAPLGATPMAGHSAAAQEARATAQALRSGRAQQLAGERQRPVYDDAALGRAIRLGVDVSGRSMHPAMPRFDLDGPELAALAAYLKTLSLQAAPGVTPDAVHFATVIQPGSDPLQRQALLDVLQTYLRDRNLGQRAELRREAAGLVRLQRSSREWVLHVWDLQGDSDAWAQQLQAHYARQPVFALLSGLGQASWWPIHAFSESMALPCIFPQVELPVLAEHDFYTVYLNRGMTLQAQALAQFLLAQPQPAALTQVYAPDAASRTAAAAFRSAWQAGGGRALREQALAQAPPPSFWQALARQRPAPTLLLWLPPDYLEQAQALGAPDAPGAQRPAIYLSASQHPALPRALDADRSGRVRLVWPQELPALRQARLDGVRRWLVSKGLAPGDETVQMNAYLAVTTLALVMGHSMDTYSREFLLERLEHLLGSALESSLYPHLSLGPGQRYASKGSYIVARRGTPAPQLQALSDWIVP